MSKFELSKMKSDETTSSRTSNVPVAVCSICKNLFPHLVMLCADSRNWRRLLNFNREMRLCWLNLLVRVVISAMLNLAVSRFLFRTIYIGLLEQVRSFCGILKHRHWDFEIRDQRISKQESIKLIVLLNSGTHASGLQKTHLSAFIWCKRNREIEEDV